jgi:hypothetical protein
MLGIYCQDEDALLVHSFDIDDELPCFQDHLLEFAVEVDGGACRLVHEGH